jgi:2-polyprenyl-3-methyl-5-hydroxy-6-metoxy-1,4-benzoquinol methylase
VTEIDRSALLDEARSLQWFHSIDFGDYVSPKRESASAMPNATLRPIWAFLQDTGVTASRCLDVGTADGIVAFTLERMGAAETVATDGTPRPTFEVAHGLLRSSVTYVTQVPDTRLEDRFEHHSFDLVVMAGFLYHLFSPLAAIAQARRLLRLGGLFMVETVYIGGDDPTLCLNPAFDVAPIEQPSTYWLATRSCLESMLKLCCFEVLASASNSELAVPGTTRRIGYVARAVRPSDVTGRPQQMITTHERTSATPNVDYRKLDHLPTGSPESTVRYEGPRGHRQLSASWQPDWNPLQPPHASS